MSKWRSFKLLIEQTSRQRDFHVRRRSRLPLLGACSGVACMLLSNSAMSQMSSETQADAGKQAFNNSCRTCHMATEGDNRLGPNLHKIIGRKAGSLPGYAFSSSMKEAGFNWDEEKLDRFIENPDQVVPGHNMKPYGGLSSSEERKKIVGFLGQQN